MIHYTGYPLQKNTIKSIDCIVYGDDTVMLCIQQRPRWRLWEKGNFVNTALNGLISCYHVTRCINHLASNAIIVIVICPRRFTKVTVDLFSFL